MSDDGKNDTVSRRGFLGMGSAALATAGMLSAANAGGQVQQPYAATEDKKPYPTKDNRSASAPGPGNPQIDAQNPDSFLPPPTDAGGVQTFKYPFGLSHKRMISTPAIDFETASSRIVTSRDHPPLFYQFGGGGLDMVSGFIFRGGSGGWGEKAVAGGLTGFWQGTRIVGSAPG